MRRLISSGSRFEAEIGYSRAVVDGDWVFVSGTTGFDYAEMTISDDVAAQADQTLKNIAAALTQAGGELRRCGSGPIHPACRRRFPGLLAGVARGVRRRPASCDDDAGGTGRSPDEDRDRGDGAAR